MSRHLQAVEPPRGPWFLSTRAEIDAFFAERWVTLSAMLEAEQSAGAHAVGAEQAQLELGEAA